MMNADLDLDQKKYLYTGLNQIATCCIYILYEMQPAKLFEWSAIEQASL